MTEFGESAGYLDFARFGPPSRAVVETTTSLLRQAAGATECTVDDLMRQETRAKAAVARLCGTDVRNVVLLPSTSLGLFQTAFAVAGGEVLVSAGEFPANTYPWVRAERAGRVTVRWLPSGYVTADSVSAALSPATTAVSVSAVDFRTGYRADLAALRAVVGDRLLVVDGIQGFGVVDEPWRAADVLVVGGQKWLRAGWGTGFAVLSDRAIDLMDPLLSGWTGAQDPGRFDDEIRPADPAAAGWSITNLSPITSGALATALELVEATGIAAIGALIADRVGELEDTLRSEGATIVSATERRAGILAFALPGVPAAQVGTALSLAGIAATVRPDQVRLSPHTSTPATVAANLLRSALRGLTRDEESTA